MQGLSAAKGIFSKANVCSSTRNSHRILREDLASSAPSRCGSEGTTMVEMRVYFGLIGPEPVALPTNRSISSAS